MTAAATRPHSWLGRAVSVLPNRCAVCQADGNGFEARLCGDCRARFGGTAARCERCALPVPAGVAVCGSCLRAPPPWRRAVAACDYAYPWDGLVGALKFEAALDLAPVLARQLEHAIRQAAAPAVDRVLPIPLAAARLRERGYNQALLLARALGGPLGLPVEVDALRRPVDTARQADLPRAGRAANVRGAFVVDPSALGALRGRALALVDDVMTTGATAAEATRVLLGAGAQSVQVWVVARTPA